MDPVAYTQNNTPLAKKLCPTSFDMMVGQEGLVGKKGVLRRIAESGHLPSMIFFGPPGTGKTSAASILAANSGMVMRQLNATTASLADVKRVAEETKSSLCGGILLYLDEIQYFNKRQQQSLLEYIEDGRITLIASTTENPYYYIYPALLSRCTVFEFKSVDSVSMATHLRRVAEGVGLFVQDLPAIPVPPEKKSLTSLALVLVAQHAAGDVRRGIGTIELLADLLTPGEAADEARVRELLPSIYAGTFDGDGDVHYDLLSCLQKSIRGSDPDAAVFYLARLLEGGDLISVCRRLQVIASEDVGLAYPMAAVIVRACCESAHELGLPEARIPLANATVMLATSPKSNTAYMAINEALQDAKSGLGRVVPKHLRAPSYDGYVYPHDYVNNFVPQQYLPDDLIRRRYYEFGENKTESAAAAYWAKVKAERPAKK